RERADRPRAAHRAADREDPRQQHSRQTALAEPHRGGAVRDAPRAGPRPRNDRELTGQARVVVTTPRGERPRGRCERVGRAVAALNAAVRDGRDRAELLDLVCGYARALTRALAATVMTVDQDGVLVVRAIAGRATVCR